MILQAKAALLATGGAGRIFAASTNAFINTGDGLGMAARAGIPLEDMEFWQFHPTGVAGAGVLHHRRRARRGRRSCSTANGERFMERYAPTLKDLAPRDVVSRCDGPGDQGRARLRPGQGLHPAQARPPRRRDDQEAPAGDPRDRPQVRQRRHHDASRSRSCRRSTTRWAACRPTSTARSSRRRTAIRTPSSRPLRGRRVRVRLRARRQPARHQFAARPARVRPRRRQPHRRAASSPAQAHTALPARRRRLHARRGWRGSTRRTGGEYVAGRRQRPAQDDAGALRRVPHPGARWTKASARSRRSPSARRSIASSDKSRSSTPRASRRSSSTT